MILAFLISSVRAWRAKSLRFALDSPQKLPPKLSICICAALPGWTQREHVHVHVHTNTKPSTNSGWDFRQETGDDASLQKIFNQTMKKVFSSCLTTTDRVKTCYLKTQQMSNRAGLQSWGLWCCSWVSKSPWNGSRATTLASSPPWAERWVTPRVETLTVGWWSRAPFTASFSAHVCRTSESLGPRCPISVCAHEPSVAH